MYSDKVHFGPWYGCVCLSSLHCLFSDRYLLIVLSHTAACPTRVTSEVKYKKSYLPDCLSSDTQVASMFLVLTLTLQVVHLLRGFQLETHDTPITSLLTESSSNAPALSTWAACICPSGQRSPWNILLTCLVTIYASSWVSIHPNIPAPNESSWRAILRRLELMFWSFVCPEIMINWAFRQWLGARHLALIYKGELSSLILSIYPRILNHKI